MDENFKERLYPLNKHIVWLDNLFTSIRLFQRLQKEGIGGTGTVKTIKTKHKKQEESNRLYNKLYNKGIKL